MSQGGDLTLSIATHDPELIDLALPIAGRISEPMRPAQIRGDHLPRIVMLHGVDDPIVPIAGAREEIKWLQSAGFTGELKEYAGVEHDIAKDMVGDIQNLLRQL
jgi:predicted esterase